MRCCIFAAVSTKPQAGDEKDSIPNQIERARQVIRQRGWTEVCDPLVVPGQSRSIDFLHEAIEEIPALAELVRLARDGKIDLVLCRDYDRLARTRALLTQLSAYLSRCLVQIYALDKPVEPVPPEQLRAYWGGVESAATVEAFAGLMAESEVARIVERHRFGMNARARAGKWVHAFAPYGYSRLAEHSTHEKPIYLDVPRVVPEEAAVVRQIERAYLEDGLGIARIAYLLNVEGRPSPRGKQWTAAAVREILQNPFYCGYVLWGYTRKARVPTAEGRFASRPRSIPAIRRLRESLGRPVTLFDLLIHADELAREGLVISKGMHEPIRTIERQRAIYDEFARRRELGPRRSAATPLTCPLFSGLLVCGTCRAPFVVHDKRVKANELVYTYSCYSRRAGRLCTNARSIDESKLLDVAFGIVADLASDPGAIDQYLESERQEQAELINQELARVEQALASVRSRRRRWDEAYESGLIELAEYGERLAEIREQTAMLTQRLDYLRAQKDRAVGRAQQRAALMEAVLRKPDLSNRPAVKAQLRSVFAELVIADGEVVSVRLRG